MCLSKEEESTIGKNCGFAKLLFILILREDGFWYRKKDGFVLKQGRMVLWISWEFFCNKVIK